MKKLMDRDKPLLSVFSLYLLLLASLAALKALPSMASSFVIRDLRGQPVFSYDSSHALVIWAGSYNDPRWPILGNLSNESKQVENALTRQGFTVATIANPTSKQIRSSIEEFIQKYGFGLNNRLVFYFAGHGWTRKNNELGYFVPVDSPFVASLKDDVEFARTALSMQEIVALAKRIEAKHVLFIFDSCFSGSLFKSRSAPPPSTFPERSIDRPVRQFITAGDANDIVPARSYFTPLLIEGLDGDADLNRDGYVTGSELGLFLPTAMARVIPSSQGNPVPIPQYGKIYDNTLDKGDIVFRVVSTSQAKPIHKFDVRAQQKSLIQPESMLREQQKNSMPEQVLVQQSDVKPKQYTSVNSAQQIPSQIRVAGWNLYPEPGFKVGKFNTKDNGFMLKLASIDPNTEVKPWGVQVASASPLRLLKGQTYTIRFKLSSSHDFDLFIRLGEYSSQRSIFKDVVIPVDQKKSKLHYEHSFVASGYEQTSTLYFQLGNAKTGTVVEINDVEVLR